MGSIRMRVAAMPRHNRQGGGRGDGRRWGSPRKRPRGRERERERDFGQPAWPLPVDKPAIGDTGDRLHLLESEAAPRPAPMCGNCLEWFADEEGGRGTCDHPGSGFLKPWSDTPACPFFRRMKDEG